MPLSEDEQRILQQIEQQFYADDPEFAREVASTTVYRDAGRNLKWAALGFAVGVVVLLGTLSTSYWVAFVGFAVMLASAIIFERNLRRMGRAGLEQLTGRGANMRDFLGSTSRRVRERLRRRDE